MGYLNELVIVMFIYSVLSIKSIFKQNHKT